MMFSKKYTRFLLVAFLFPLQLFAQDITGVWKGEFYVDSTKKTYPFELSISESKGKLTGYSRISFTEEGTPEIVFREHTIKKEGDTYIMEDKSQLSKASTVSQPKEVKKTMIVTLTISDSVMVLKGAWNTNKTRRFLAASGKVSVQRKNDFKETAIFKKLDELDLTKDLSYNKPEEKPAVILTRKEEVAMTVIATKEKSVDTTKNAPASAIPINIPLPEKPKEPVIVKPVPKPVVKTPPPVVAKAVPPKPVKVAEAKPLVKTAPAQVVPKPVAVVPKPVVPAQPKPIPAQAMVSVSKTAAVEVNERSNSSIQSIYYKTDSLQLTLYDNGEVDGDTVSVLLNGKVIIAKQRLDIKPNVHTIYFDKNTPDSMMLVMYAENLGSIPPNTGLLVVHDGKAIYEVRFSADLSSNAAIILRRKKDE